MVFGQPVYNTQQRRAALQQFKDYIDEKIDLLKLRKVLCYGWYIK